MLVAVGGCVPSGDIDAPAADDVCDESADCSAAEVCVAGGCVVGTCEPAEEQACDDGLAADAEVCCADRELCSALTLTCVPDPDAPPLFCEPVDIACVQCAAQEECSTGQFCSSGLCLEAAGRQACAESFQCSDGEHCDRNAFLCVPLRPCSLCSATSPHLCCFEGEVCIDEGDVGGTCVDEDAPIVCDEDADCGPGLECDEESGECFANL